MKISLEWLKDFIDLNETDEELSEILTAVGLEVEGLERTGGSEKDLEPLLVGKILSCEKHPNADKLQLCRVDLGKEGQKNIICGAPNVKQGQTVVVAVPGVTVHPIGNKPFKIGKAKIRGVESEGMICSKMEIGISEDHDGIWVLPEDRNAGESLLKNFKVKSNSIFEIGLTPNRGDATSHYGVARDLKAYFDRPLKDLVKSDVSFRSETDLKIELNNPEACPRYAGVVLTGLKAGESPQWLKDRLISIGLSPINSIVDITNYVMHDLGQPLHAFDMDRIKGNTIKVRLGAKGEKLTTLDEIERKVEESDLMICDAEEPMCFGGVFGGINSGVSESTTSIFLESACFDPSFVRKTSLTHQLKTDSAYRFERGTDIDGVIPGLLRAVQLLSEIHNAEVSSEVFDLYPEKIENRNIAVDKEVFWSNIGHMVEESEVEKILELLDFKIISNTGSEWVLEVPSYRVEVTEEADIYEEFLRIYGFNKIPLKEQFGSDYFAHFPELTEEQFNDRVMQFFVDRGYWEAMNNSISNPGEQGSVDSDFEKKGVELLNPLSEDLSHMRGSLLPGLLNGIKHNVSRKMGNLRFVERGNIYQKIKDGYNEQDSLGIVLQGRTGEESWSRETAELEFKDLNQILSDFFTSIGIHNQSISPSNWEAMENGGLSIAIGKESIGRIGKVSSIIRKKWGLETRIWFAELKLKDLYQLSLKSRSSFTPISKFPQVYRDLSIVLDESIEYEKVVELAQKHSGSFLTKMNCFSIFKGKPLEEGKKSYAINLQFERGDRTFLDSEIDEMMNAIIKAYEDQLKAIIRR